MPATSPCSFFVSLFLRFLKLLFGGLNKIPPTARTFYCGSAQAMRQLPQAFVQGQTFVWWSMTFTSPHTAVGARCRFTITAASARNIGRYSAQKPQDTTRDQYVLAPGCRLEVEDVVEQDDGMAIVFLNEDASYNALGIETETETEKDNQIDAACNVAASQPSLPECAVFTPAAPPAAAPSDSTISFSMPSSPPTVDLQSFPATPPQAAQPPAPAATSTRLLVFAPSRSLSSDQLSGDLSGNNGLTILQLPPDLQLPLESSDGANGQACDAAATWHKLTQASMNLLSLDKGIVPSSLVEQLMSGSTDDYDDDDDDAGQSTGDAAPVSVLPTLPVLQPVDTVTRTADIVPGTRIVSNVRAAAPAVG
jgi:hypothetical protein